jgi:hypothetical protein
MRARSVVVVDVRGEDAAQMALVEDHDVVRDTRGESNRSRARYMRSAKVNVWGLPGKLL